MNPRLTRRLAPGVIAVALPLTWLALSLPQSAAAGTPSKSAVAVTALSNRPDSGVYGDWANDSFTRTAKITLVGKAALTKCAGLKTGTCYHWTGLVSDTKGSFVTIVGASSPGNGDRNGGPVPQLKSAATGAMSGGISYDFYANSATAASKLVPKAENDHGKPPAVSTGAWVTQFFAGGTKFWDATGSPASYLALNTGGWTYTLPFGAVKACPHVASQWVDAAPAWGANAGDGNILVPDAAHC